MKSLHSEERVHLSDFQKGKSSFLRILPLSLALFVGYLLQFASEYFYFYPPMISFSLPRDNLDLFLNILNSALKSLLLPVLIYMVKEKMQLACIWAGINLNLSFLMLRIMTIFGAEGFVPNYLPVIVFSIFEGFMLAGVIVFLLGYSKNALQMYLAILAYKLSLFFLSTILNNGLFRFISMRTVYDLLLLLFSSGIFFVLLYFGLVVQKKIK